MGPIENVDDFESREEYVEDESVWKLVSYKNVSLKVRYLSPKMDLGQLVGFNNTGNVCVWPSEESLAVYCLNNTHVFQDKRVLEIGGGMTSLAGCMLAATGLPELTHITDGNATSVKNLQKIVKELKKSDEKKICDLDAFELRWDQELHKDLYSNYDVILSADCLFFKESAENLVQCLHNLLRPNGQAIITAPSREGTLVNFVNLAEKKFHVKEVKDYSIEVTKAHESFLDEPGYNPDIHYPKLLILTKQN